MSPTALADLTPRRQRRAIARAAARIIATTVALLTLYAIVPAAGESGAGALAELIIGLALFGAIRSGSR